MCVGDAVSQMVCFLRDPSPAAARAAPGSTASAPVSTPVSCTAVRNTKPGFEGTQAWPSHCAKSLLPCWGLLFWGTGTNEVAQKLQQNLRTSTMPLYTISCLSCRGLRGCRYCCNCAVPAALQLHFRLHVHSERIKHHRVRHESGSWAFVARRRYCGWTHLQGCKVTRAS